MGIDGWGRLYFKYPLLGQGKIFHLALIWDLHAASRRKICALIWRHTSCGNWTRKPASFSSNQTRKPVLFSKKKNSKQGSPTSPPRNIPDVIGQEREKSLSNPASEAPPNLAKEKIIHDPSNVWTANLQTHPRKANPRQLPLKKHRLVSIYYHSAFTMYPRHNLPENIATPTDVLDLLCKVFSSRARVSTQKVWNLIIESWSAPKKSSFLLLPPLTQESNVGNDGLMLQSTFDVNIKEED